MSTSSRRRRKLAFETRGSKRILLDGAADEEDDAELEGTSTSPVFPRGAIKKITLKNFMTFNNFTEEFDPKLNVILAPNGTGKSSLVCGICLGLGGKPALLSRQRKLSGFVTRGEDEASTEIHLSDGESGTETVIRREFWSDRESSNWYIDGCPVNAKEVEGLMCEMNIQLNNLLQFMPQDRVSEFAGLSPVQLLLETERAIDLELFDMHQRLITMGETSTSAQKRLNNLQKDLEQANNRKASLQRDVDRLRQVNDLKKKVEQLEAKQHLLSVDEASKALKESEKKLKDGTNRLKAIKKDLITHEKEKTVIARKTEKSRRSVSALREDVSSKDGAVNSLSARLEQHETEVEDNHLKLKNLERESKRQSQMIQELQEEIVEKEKDLEQTDVQHKKIEEAFDQQSDTVKQLTHELRAANHALNEADSLYSAAQNQKQQLQRVLEQLEMINIQRMHELERRRPLFKGLSRAHEELKKHRGDFKKPVIGPLITEISVPDPRIAADLELQIPLATWTLFVVQCSEDLAKLKALNLISELNVINFNGDLQIDPLSSSKKDDLSKYGITGCLMELFDAIPIVKVILNNECDLENTFVGTQQCEDCLEALLDNHPNIQKIYTPEKSISVMKSRYSAARSFATTSVLPPSLLGQDQRSGEEKNEALEKISSLNKELCDLLDKKSEQQRKFDSLKADQHEAEMKKQELRYQKRQLEDRCLSSKRRIANLQRDLDRLKNLPDPIESEHLIKRDVEKKQDLIYEGMKKIRFELKEQWRIVEALTHASLALKCLEVQNITSEKKVEQIREKAQAIEELVATLQEIVEQDSSDLSAVEERLSERFPSISDWSHMLEDLPADADELEGLILETRHKINMMTVNNPDALTLYETLTTQIEQLVADIEEEKVKVSQSSETIDQAKENWLSKLQCCVSKINDAFASNIESIGCIGQVALSGVDSQKHSFHDYALEIKVKFRANEPLQVLDSVRQSGGERVVATTLYLISLQTVAGISFRVMDEINHGMDEENERKVMDILAALTEDEAMPQTILLTPKMFKNPEFLTKATTIFIMNGPLVCLEDE